VGLAVSPLRPHALKRLLTITITSMRSRTWHMHTSHMPHMHLRLHCTALRSARPPPAPPRHAPPRLPACLSPSHSHSHTLPCE
jgi:hypothetical protein